MACCVHSDFTLADATLFSVLFQPHIEDRDAGSGCDHERDYVEQSRSIVQIMQIVFTHRISPTTAEGLTNRLRYKPGLDHLLLSLRVGRANHGLMIDHRSYSNDV